MGSANQGGSQARRRIKTQAEKEASQMLNLKLIEKNSACQMCRSDPHFVHKLSGSRSLPYCLIPEYFIELGSWPGYGLWQAKHSWQQWQKCYA